MAKVKAYAISIGSKDSYILLQPGTETPDGYTLIVPPDPMPGYIVVWNGSDWEYQEYTPQSVDEPAE